MYGLLLGSSSHGFRIAVYSISMMRFMAEQCSAIVGDGKIKVAGIAS